MAVSISDWKLSSQHSITSSEVNKKIMLNIIRCDLLAFERDILIPDSSAYKALAIRVAEPGLGVYRHSSVKSGTFLLVSNL